MRQISEAEIEARLAFDNPWWQDDYGVEAEYRDLPQRDYLASFCRHVQDVSIRRAVVLMGPRRVGKTVMVYQAIQTLLDKGVPGRKILYLSLETPIYTGLSLERLLTLFRNTCGHEPKAELYVFFDEVQYLKDWEVHLKSLVDSYRQIKFVVTGSAAAALRLKSRESGAGRFTEFLLPPLTFAEYLGFVRKDHLVRETGQDELHHHLDYEATDIDELNKEFIKYLNFGGYPEAVMTPAIQQDTARYIKADIVDKVLLRDLPSLYGIKDIQELNRLFTVIAYNTGDEVSLEGLAKSSGVAKNTLKRYLQYLEAAFLIRTVDRLDINARRFKRATTFKVYLTNPSIRAALFEPIREDGDEAMGSLTETAIFSQWMHDTTFIDHLHYARWKGGEVDIVACDLRHQRANWAAEVKWSDRYFNNPGELRALLAFCRTNELDRGPLVTTKTRSGKKTLALDGKQCDLTFVPSAVYCYSVGKNSTRREDSYRAFLQNARAVMSQRR